MLGEPIHTNGIYGLCFGMKGEEMSLFDFPKDAQREILDIMKKERKQLLNAEAVYVMREINKLKEKK